MTRRLDIDWLRGLAVLLMIMWHSIDSWTVQEGRDSTAFFAIAFAAGWVAPLFLFLAGVSLPLAAMSRMNRGCDRPTASWMVQKRGWQVFLIAHLFRLQSFLLNPNGTWSGVLKPDILNVLGLGMVAAAWCWGRADRTPRALAIWLLLPALVIVAIVTPLSGGWWWPTLLHPRLAAYIRPVGNNGQFSLFPAVAFIFAGTFLGAFLAEGYDRDGRFYRRLAGIGAALLVAGLAAGFTPWSTSRWIYSATVFLWRCGGMSLAVVLVWLYFQRHAPNPQSPLVVFGQTSLFVYWVHVELAYGVFTYPLRHTLALPWSVAAYLVFTAFMFGLAVLWQRRARGPLIPSHMAASYH